MGVVEMETTEGEIMFYGISRCIVSPFIFLRLLTLSRYMYSDNVYVYFIPQ